MRNKLGGLARPVNRDDTDRGLGIPQKARVSA